MHCCISIVLVNSNVLALTWLMQNIYPPLILLGQVPGGRMQVVSGSRNPDEARLVLDRPDLDALGPETTELVLFWLCFGTLRQIDSAPIFGSVGCGITPPAFSLLA